MDTRITGSVRKLKDGFGFIAGDDGQDYFFHWSAMLKDTKDFRELAVKDRVDFGISQSPKGPRAVEIRVKYAEGTGAQAQTTGAQEASQG